MTEETTHGDGGPQRSPRLLFQRVQKRDGTLVDFDRGKIAAAILKAMRATNTGDSVLADQMADRVIIHLARNYEDQLLNIEDIQDAVETVLMEHGQSRVAKAYILYRSERARRRALRIQTAGLPSPPRQLLSTEVEHTSASELVTWNRDRIVSALVRETGLARETAVQISREVEEQLIVSRAMTITTDLVRELVNAKLVEHGFHHERTLHARLGVPLYDVEHTITREALPPESTDLTLAGAILREYGLRRVFPSDVVEAHLRGEVFLDGLERVNRPAQLVLSPAYLLKFGLQLPHAMAHARPARHAFTLVAHVVKASTALQSTLSTGIGWDALDVVFGPLVAEASERELEQLAQTVVFDFSQQSEAQGGRPLSVDLHVYGTAPARLAAMHALGPGGEMLSVPYGRCTDAIRRFAVALLRAFRAGEGRGHPFVCPRLVVHVTDELLADPGAAPFLAEALDLAEQWGTPVFQFDRGGVSRIGEFELPGGAATRYPWQQRIALAGEVTVNLAQAALLGSSNWQSLLEMLVDFCRLSVKAHLARRTFLNQLLAQSHHGPLAMLCLAADGDPLFLLHCAVDRIGLLGLDEMLQHHLGKRLGSSADAAARTAEVLGLLAHECERYSAMHGIRFVTGAATEARRSAAAAAHDARHFALEHDAPRYYTPAGQLNAALRLSAADRIGVESVHHPKLEGGAVTLLDAGSLPAGAEERVRWLAGVHRETRCRSLAVAVDITVCLSCGAAARGRADICPACASSRVTGVTRLLGPLEVLPRWEGSCAPLIAARSAY